MKIYVASSWRNERQPQIVKALQKAGHKVYDFRNPEKGNRGFHWSEIDPNWQQWDMKQYRDNLFHPIAIDGYVRDFKAMQWADACVLVMPCGRSAHLEGGYFIGANKILIILLSDGEPELMYRMATHVCVSESEVVNALCVDASEVKPEE